jgi:hypothetical protein
MFEFCLEHQINKIHQMYQLKKYLQNHMAQIGDEVKESKKPESRIVARFKDGTTKEL